MKVLLYLIAIYAMLYALERFIPGPGDADARGNAKQVTCWPWEGEP